MADFDDEDPEMRRLVEAFEKQNPVTMYAKCLEDDMPEMFLDMWVTKGETYIVQKMGYDELDNVVVVVSELDGTLVKPTEEMEALLASRFKFFTAYNN